MDGYCKEYKPAVKDDVRKDRGREIRSLKSKNVFLLVVFY